MRIIIVFFTSYPFSLRYAAIYSSSPTSLRTSKR
nr:MAG TPA: hypothetical protein [Caudoviricetes sp.]